MIKLNIEEYCHNCEDFEPTCEKIFGRTLIGPIMFDQIVTCVNKNKCRCIHTHIKQSFEKEKNNA